MLTFIFHFVHYFHYKEFEGNWDQVEAETAEVQLWQDDWDDDDMNDDFTVQLREQVLAAAQQPTAGP